MTTPSESGAASASSSTTQRPRGSYGANVLWTHLLRKDISMAPQPSLSKDSVPPIAPVDKTGTSMRILVHDTQANLEKFSARVDKLTSGVEETKREMVTMKTLFGEEHDKLIERTVTLVNRCQATLQSTMGTPAQASKVQDILDDLASKGNKLESFDKKFDLLQMMIQTQMQTLQSIQEHQVTLLTSLAPVLPLLQAIPVQIDAAKGDIKDAIRTMADLTSHSSCSASREPTDFKKKRSSSTMVSPEGGHGRSSLSPVRSSSPPRKRPRTQESPPRSSWHPTMDRSPFTDRTNRTSSPGLHDGHCDQSSANMGAVLRRPTLKVASPMPYRESNPMRSGLAETACVSKKVNRVAPSSTSPSSSTVKGPNLSTASSPPGRLSPHEMRPLDAAPVSPSRSRQSVFINELSYALPDPLDRPSTSAIPFPAHIRTASARLATSVTRSPAAVSSPARAGLTPRLNRRPTESRLVYSTPRRGFGSLFSRAHPTLGQQAYPAPTPSGLLHPTGRRSSTDAGTVPLGQFRPPSMAVRHAQDHLSPDVPLSQVIKSRSLYQPVATSDRPESTVDPAIREGTKTNATAPPSPAALFDSDENLIVVSRVDPDQATSRETVTSSWGQLAGTSVRPMSLKDRKAHETAIPKFEGKRFIPVDDIDDENDGCSFE